MTKIDAIPPQRQDAYDDRKHHRWDRRDAPQQQLSIGWKKQVSARHENGAVNNHEDPHSDLEENRRAWEVFARNPLDGPMACGPEAQGDETAQQEDRVTPL